MKLKVKKFVHYLSIYVKYEIAGLNNLMMHARKFNDIVVDYDIYSSCEGNEIEESSDLEFYEVFCWG